MIHVESVVHLHSLVYELTLNPLRFTIFSTDGASGVKSFKIHIFWIFVSCLWSDHTEFMADFMVFNLWIGLGFIFEPCS
jgi:hypothetical protein